MQSIGHEWTINEMGKEQEKDQKKSAIQDDILLATLQLFAEKGYFNTSLTDIQERSGLKSTGAIYQHYKTKQLIAAALYSKILDSLSISIDDIRRRNKKPVDQLREIVGLFFSLTDQAPEIMRLLLVLQIREFLPEEKPLLETAALQKIYKILQAGIRTGEVRAIDHQLAYAQFFGIIFQTIRLILAGMLEKQAEAYQSETWTAAWGAIAKK